MIFGTVAKHLPSGIVHPLEMVVVSIVIIKMLDLLDGVKSNGHADLVISIHSSWIGVVDHCESLVEITDIGKNILEATIHS
jgi:hypothetical protein